MTDLLVIYGFILEQHLENNKIFIIRIQIAWLESKETAELLCTEDALVFICYYTLHDIY